MLPEKKFHFERDGGKVSQSRIRQEDRKPGKGELPRFSRGGLLSEDRLATQGDDHPKEGCKERHTKNLEREALVQRAGSAQKLGSREDHVCKGKSLARRNYHKRTRHL